MKEIKQKSVKIWLFLCLCFILSMVLIGGLTRLTRAGLSITEWNVISGILPPLNEANWLSKFEKYKQIPEFKLIHSQMSLAEFKKIYLIEYFHRLLGRLTGFVLLIPLFFFWITKRIKMKDFFRLSAIFSLILIQGVIGWFMVKSGLTERTSVNEFMLAFHLLFALLIFSLLSLEFFKKCEKPSFYKLNALRLNNKILSFAMTLFVFQIFLGALVASLHIVGFCYENTTELCSKNPLKIISSEHFASIKYLYMHRISAIFVFCFLGFMSFRNIKNRMFAWRIYSLLYYLLFKCVWGFLAYHLALI